MKRKHLDLFFFFHEIQIFFKLFEQVQDDMQFKLHHLNFSSFNLVQMDIRLVR